MVFSGIILIREVADAPVIMGISKPAGLKSPCGEVKIVNPLFVGIDVSSRSNVAYLMKPDGRKHSSFSVQNNLGGAKLLSEKIVSALCSMQLSDVVIGLEATSKAVRAAARGSYRLPKTVNDTVNQAMAVSIASMRALKDQAKVLDKAIERQFEIIPNTLTSIPGIGKVYSAGIIAEIGDIHRFDSQASVAKFAGLVWTQHQSGEFEAEHSRMIKSGNRYLRYYLLEAANSVRRCDSEFRRYYDLKFKEVNKYQHKRALALTARKLVRLVFRLLKDNRLYIPPES